MSADDAELDELVNDFVTESREHLAHVESDLLGLEASGEAPEEATNRVFRAVHSVKGVAGFLGLENINRLAHSLESVLDLMRKGRLEPDAGLVDVLLGATDRLRELIEAVGASDGMQIDDQLTRLTAYLDGDVNKVSKVATPSMEIGPGEWLLQLKLATSRLSLEMGIDPPQLVDEIGRVGALRSGAAELMRATDEGNRDPVTIVLSTRLTPEDLTDRLHLEPGDVQVLREAISTPAAAAPAVAAPPPAPRAAPVAAAVAATAHKQPANDAAAPVAKEGGSSGSPKRGEAAQDSIRVSVDLLDRLMNLSGELVLGRNQLLQALDSGNDKGVEASSGRLNQVISEMQEAVMRTRMQPIGTLFQRFPRVVRDLAGKLGKQCALEADGKEVDLDRSILEALSDPLTHIVRNSVDHGMETPEQRRAAGKSAEGCVRMAASQVGGNVRIEIVDDGRGIDPKKLRDKAVERGVITPAQASTMSDREAVNLIFAAGFSTAEKVTDVSGRGVGMDVVRSNIERLGGTVDVVSQLGAGTRLTITIPLTLAILPAMVIACGARRYVLAQANVAELVQIRDGEGAARIAELNGRELLRLRGSVLPLVRLRTVLGEPPADTRREPIVVVVESSKLRYGLVIDAPPDAEEIVVKPLSRHFKTRPEYAGATILGDGTVAMILDAVGIANRCDLDEVAEDLLADSSLRDDGDSDEAVDLVLFQNHPEETFAVPLGLVDHIRRVAPSDVREVGGRTVLAQDERALPIVMLDRVVPSRPVGDAKVLSVLMLRINEQTFGVVASGVEDIKRVAVQVDDRTLAMQGVIGSFQYEGRTVRLLDAGAVAQIALPHCFTATPSTKKTSELERAPRVLFAEDTRFFRQHVSKVLQGAGFEVTEAEDGDVAWQALERGESFDIVVTDIQMPNCDGLQLTRRIRGSAEHKDLPVVALTSLSSDEDQSEGRAAGVTAYLIKLDDAALIAAVRNYMGALA